MAAASGSQIAVEYENWSRIITLIHYGGKTVCLDILHKQEKLPTDGGKLYNALSAKMAEFQRRLKKGVIKQNQYDDIFPPNQITDISKWDITLFTFVISAMFGKKYKTLIDDLRQWRNAEFHKGKISFTPAEFNITWTDITTMLKNHGLDLTLVADLKICALDAHSQYRKAYLEIELLRLEIQQTAIKKDGEATKKEFDNMKKDVETLKQDVAGKQSERIFLNVHETVSNFFGREDVLKDIHTKLTTENEYNYHAVALTGLGGLGKSQIAAKYAENMYKNFYYEAVFWLNATELEQSLRLILNYLECDVQNSSTECLTQLLCKKLKDEQYLFILDDTVDSKSLFPMLKNLRLNKKPSVLITSQYSLWKNSKIQHISLKVFNAREAQQFLEKEMIKSTPEKDIEELASTLKSFPLALQQAICYIKENDMVVSDYLKHFKDNREQLLDINLEDYGIDEYEKTLLTVWKLALNKLKKNRTAVEVVRMMAYMDNNYINKNTFLSHEGVTDELVLNEIIKTICAYSLVNISAKTDYLYMHPLVQKVIKVKIEQKETLEPLNLLISMLNKIQISDSIGLDFVNTDENNTWYPHVRHLILSYKNINIDNNSIFEVCHNREDMQIVNVLLIKIVEINEKIYLNNKNKVYFQELLQMKIFQVKTLLSSSYKIPFIANMIKTFNIKYASELQDKDCFYNYEWYLQEVLLLSMAGNTIEAMKKFETLPSFILELYTNEMVINIYQLRIRVYRYMKLFDKAIFECHKILPLLSNPVDKIHIYINLCFIFISKSNIDEAKPYVNEIEQISSKINIPANHQIGFKTKYIQLTVMIKDKKYKEVRLLLLEQKQKLKVNCNNFRIIFSFDLQLAQVHLFLKEYKECEKLVHDDILKDIESHENILDVNDYKRIAYYHMIITLFMLNKIDDIITILKSEYSNECDAFIWVELYKSFFETFQKKRTNLTSTPDEINETLKHCIILKKYIRNVLYETLDTIIL